MHHLASTFPSSQELFMRFYPHRSLLLKLQLGLLAQNKIHYCYTIILLTANLFVSITILHPFWMIVFLVLTATSFSLLGFILGIWADNWEKLAIAPTLIITPLAFLGGSFYSISMLPPFWQKITLLNPVVYLISGFRWSFYENADVSVYLSLLMIIVFMFICLIIIYYIFRTGYRLRV